MASGIYAIVNTKSKLWYVGQSQNIAVRWSQHIHMLEKGHMKRKCNRRLLHSWQKHGRSAFQFIELEHCSLDRLTEREEYWLQEVRDHHGFEVANSEGPVDNPMRGKKHTPETLRKISEKVSAAPRTQIWKDRIGASNKGKVVSAESRAKMKASKVGIKNPLMLGDKNPSCRPENRARMIYNNPSTRPEVRAKISKPIMDLDSDFVYPSVTACALALGVGVPAVTNALRRVNLCKGKRLAYLKKGLHK